MLLLSRFTFFLLFLFPFITNAFPPPESLQVTPIPRLPRALHHGLLLTFKPITNPNLLHFKVEVSLDNGAHWYLFEDQIRPYDHRHILLPYRTKNYGLATGRDYQIRLCADYGSEVQCVTSASFRTPAIAANDPIDSQDEDGDILTNAQEYNFGTDPRNPDSDDDQMADSFEVARNLDPNLSQKPAIVTNEASIDFHSGTPFGFQTSQHHIFTVINNGKRVLRISNGIFSGTDPTQFRYLNKMLEVVEVPPYQSRAVAIDFLPTTLGRLTASLDILSDDKAHFPSSIAVSGVASQIAHLKVESDPRLNFSATRVGENSETKTILISNSDSDSPLSVVLFPSHTLNFLVIPNRFPLAPGAMQKVQITFAPEWAGTYEGLLEIHGGNAADKNLVQLPLVASATGPSPKMRMTTTAVNFGATLVGKETTRELVIFNDGPGALHIKKMDFGRDGDGGANGFVLSSKSLVVPPNGSNRVAIFFKPLASRDYTSQLCFVTNEPNPSAVSTSCQTIRSIGQGLNFPNVSQAVVLSGVGQ